MAVKRVEIPDIGTVKLYKRKGARSIRLSITPAGDVHVTMPNWLPFSAGTNFALSKIAWIHSQQSQRTMLIANGQAIGKSHHLYFYESLEHSETSSRIIGTTIKITHPINLPSTDKKVQKTAEQACIRALRTQATKLLPGRLQTLAIKHSCDYKIISIKRLKGRWGSCDTEGNIVLNLFLMQLPWHLIDYVILHELTHTRVLHHGPDFWAEFEKLLPGAKSLKREVRAYSPTVGIKIADVKAIA